MSLLEHLRTNKAPLAPPAPVVVPAPAPPASDGTPAAAPPPPPPPPVSPPPIEPARPVRGQARSEALNELKTRVHEELIRDLDPEQLLGDTSFTSPARRAVEQAAEEKLSAADATLGRQ